MQHTRPLSRTAAALGLLLAWTATAAAAQVASAVPRSQLPLRMVAPAPGAGGAVAAATPGEVGYIASDVAHAYGLNPMCLNGAGVTIAIVVASDEPNLQIDLAGFDAASDSMTFPP